MSFYPVFRLPFRIFFLAAALFSLISVGLWGAYWGGIFQFNPFGGGVWWHAHEMIYGFSGAVLVGFLLTAAKNWTGLPGLAGWPLGLLFILWLLPRFLYFGDEKVVIYLAVIFETGFWILANYFYSRMIIKKRLWRNIGFSVILLALALINILMIQTVIASENYLPYLHSGVVFFVVVITIIGGRIIPLFTASATGATKSQPVKWLEMAIILLSVSLLIWCLVNGIVAPSKILAVGLSLLFILQVVRLVRWPIIASMSNSMLWSLYLGYIAMILGIALLSAYHFGVIYNLSAAIHMLTIGAIGLMILTMSSRVSLGHTGRKIIAGKGLTLAFVILFLSALVRAVLPLFNLAISAQYIYVIAALGWCVSYLIWLVRFTPVLLATRADGKAG